MGARHGQPRDRDSLGLRGRTNPCERGSEEALAAELELDVAGAARALYRFAGVRFAGREVGEPKRARAAPLGDARAQRLVVKALGDLLQDVQFGLLLRP